MVTTLQCRIQRDEEDLLPSTNARGSCGGKADQLAEAGISTKGAQRYEELACGHGSTRAYNLAIERDDNGGLGLFNEHDRARQSARLGLGVDISLHGFVRLPDLSGFAAGMQKQFAETFLPGSLVYAIGCIAIGETVVGTLLVLGLWVRPALTSGSLLMILLLAGTSLLQNWSVAGLQLGYLAFYAAVFGHRDLRSLLHRRRIAEPGRLTNRPGIGSKCAR